MIKTNDLTKIFRTEEVETTALNKVTLNVKEGEYVAVMGRQDVGNPLSLTYWDYSIIPAQEVIYSMELRWPI